MNTEKSREATCRVPPPMAAGSQVRSVSMVQAIACGPLVVAARAGLVILWLLCAAAGAQQPRNQPGSYRPPAGPTLTPYLDYFNRPTGVLDRYHQYVVPRQQLSQRLQQQERVTLQQERNLQTLQTQVGEIQSGGLGPQLRAPGTGVTGIGATFMNFSHYFSGRR